MYACVSAPPPVIRKRLIGCVSLGRVGDTQGNPFSLFPRTWMYSHVLRSSSSSSSSLLPLQKPSHDGFESIGSVTENYVKIVSNMSEYDVSLFQQSIDTANKRKLLIFIHGHRKYTREKASLQPTKNDLIKFMQHIETRGKRISLSHQRLSNRIQAVLSKVQIENDENLSNLRKLSEYSCFQLLLFWVTRAKFGLKFRGFIEHVLLHYAGTVFGLSSKEQLSLFCGYCRNVSASVAFTPVIDETFRSSVIKGMETILASIRDEPEYTRNFVVEVKEVLDEYDLNMKFYNSFVERFSNLSIPLTPPLKPNLPTRYGCMHERKCTTLWRLVLVVFFLCFISLCNMCTLVYLYSRQKNILFNAGGHLYSLHAYVPYRISSQHKSVKDIISIGTDCHVKGQFTWNLEKLWQDDALMAKDIDYQGKLIREMFEQEFPRKGIHCCANDRYVVQICPGRGSPHGIYMYKTQGVDTYHSYVVCDLLLDIVKMDSQGTEYWREIESIRETVPGTTIKATIAYGTPLSSTRTQSQSFANCHFSEFLPTLGAFQNFIPYSFQLFLLTVQSVRRDLAFALVDIIFQYLSVSESHIVFQVVVSPSYKST